MRIQGDPWGGRAQLGATAKLLDDLETGNRDGIIGNEAKPAEAPGNAFERNPLAARARDALSVGLSRQDEIDRLSTFMKTVEAEWGQPALAPEVRAKMSGGALYAAQKAIRLKRLGRTPAEVTDGFIAAKGKVDGREIPARELHYEKWAPQGVPSGKTVVISPGYMETGRTFEEQIQQLNAKGHAVIVMDHQWAGQSEGKPGGIDSGFGVARDVAAMTAFAAEEAKRDFGDDGRVVLMGNSMGGGPGALGAALMNDLGKIELEGAAMPKGVDLVLQAPFLGATPSALNLVLQGGAQIPMLNRVQLPGAGLPDLTDDPRAEALVSQGIVLEDVRSQLSAFMSAQADIEQILGQLRGGARPSGRVTLVGNAEDTLANPERWTELKDLLGSQLELETHAGKDHVMSQARGQQDHAVDALERLFAGPDTLAEPRQRLKLAQLEVRLDAGGRRGSLAVDLPLREIDTQPLGDRDFAAGLDQAEARLPMPWADDPGKAKLSVVGEGTEAKLRVEVDGVNPSALLQLEAPLEIITPAGQLVLLELAPERLVVDERAPHQAVARRSLENAKKNLTFYEGWVTQLKGQLADPSTIPVSGTVDGVPADQHARARIAEAERLLSSTSAELDQRRAGLRAAMDEADPILAAAALHLGLDGDNARLKAATPALVRAQQRVNDLDDLVTKLGALPQTSSIQASLKEHEAELAEARTTLGDARAEHRAALDEGFSKVDRDELLYSFEVVTGFEGTGVRELKGTLQNAARSRDLHEGNLQRIEAQRDARVASLPASIAGAEADVARVKDEIAALEAQLSSSEPVLRTID
jgi:pimeloyl-ACP methyl ester carboxylesterase